jgi:hypothetical protein
MSKMVFSSCIILLILCSLCINNVDSAIAMTRNFLTQFGSAAHDHQFRHCMDGSGSGSIYVSGSSEISSSSSLIGSANKIQANNMGGSDWFTLKYNSDGVLQWMRVLKSPHTDYGWGCASDLSGNVYSIGSSQGYLQSTLGVLNPYNLGYWDSIVASYDPVGNLRWITNALAKSGYHDYCNHVVTKDNFVWVLTQNDSPLAKILYKLDSTNGVIIWSQTWTASNNGIGVGQMLIDSNNYIIFAGWTAGTVGPSVDSAGNTVPGFINAGGNDGFIVMYDAVTGSKLANIPLATSGQDYAVGIAVDGTG